MLVRLVAEGLRLFMAHETGPFHEGRSMVVHRRDVFVLYGGRSTEHEVSCRSAAFIIDHLDPEKYRIHAVGIDGDGAWWPQDIDMLRPAHRGKGPVPIVRGVSPILRGGGQAVRDGAGPAAQILAAMGADGVMLKDAVIFPVTHGTFGEDGTLQGLFELAEIAFVGPDTLGSAVGMDKVVSKVLAQAAGVPVVPWRDLRQQDFAVRGPSLCQEAVANLGLPLFVKPARLGSSVGVTKVRRPEDLEPAVKAALTFDDRVLIEKGLTVREIEVAALGDYEPELSVPGEVIPHADFYSYDAKYTDAKAATVAVPADLTPELAERARELARKVYVALGLYGMARIDLFLEPTTNHYYFNEVNTIPGFTEISQYPQLWQASGLPAGALLDRLVTLAVARRSTKAMLVRQRR